MEKLVVSILTNPMFLNFAKKLLLALLRKLAARTDNNVDDQLVAELELALSPSEGV